MTTRPVSANIMLTRQSCESQSSAPSLQAGASLFPVSGRPTVSTSVEIESLAVYEAERAKHEPAWIAGDISLEEYRAKVDPLWDEHLARVAPNPDPGTKPSRRKKATPEGEDAEAPSTGEEEADEDSPTT